MRVRIDESERETCGGWRECEIPPGKQMFWIFTLARKHCKRTRAAGWKSRLAMILCTWPVAFRHFETKVSQVLPTDNQHAHVSMGIGTQ